MIQNFNDNWLFYKEGHEDDKKEVTLPHDAMLYETRTPEAPGKNLILVKADNHNQPDSRWYSGAGIIRPVSLHVLPKEHILIDGVRITTKAITPKAKLQIEADHTEGITGLTYEITDVSGSQVYEGSFEAKSETLSNAEATVANPNLWSAENPYLYTLKVKAFSGGEKVHEVTETFGIRTITWSNEGLFINGSEVKLRGGCLHHDNGILGARADSYAEERRVRMLKEAGYNAIRSAHNPCSKAMLKACDKYGVYMMDELWDMWYKHKTKYDYASEFMDNYEGDIAFFIRKNYNHPSVIMYSIGNEVSEPATKKGVDLSVKIRDLIIQKDPTRPVTAGYNLVIMSRSAKGKELYENKDDVKKDSEGGGGMNSTLFNMIASFVGTAMTKAANAGSVDRATSPALDVLDIAGYNYASGRYPKDGRLHPDRIICGTETFPQDIAKNWEMVGKFKYLIGDFMWVSWDYLGEAGLGAWSYHPDAKGFEKPYPWLIAGAGAFDILGNKNAALFLAQAVWGVTDKPIIGVRPCNHPGEKLIKSVWRGSNAIHSWAFRGCEGNKAVIEVFSGDDSVELFLNNKSLGKRKTKNCVATYKTAYRYGILKAVAYDALGKETGVDELEYYPTDMRLLVEPEKTHVKKGETVFVPISIVNSSKVVESNADETLKVEVEGGELLGFGSAEPRSEESFVSGIHTTFYGQALAAVRAGEAGLMRVTVTSESGMKEGAEIYVNEE